jgi:heterodisulfide reductase subunit B
LKHFGIETVDLKGASCCPAPGVFGSFDMWTWLVVAARNITIAEEMGVDITLTCNGCYATLQEANFLLKRDAKLKDDVNKALKSVGREYKGTSEVKHIVQVLSEDIGYENIKKQLKRPLKGINVAVHYGCHYLKPSDVREHGTAERPTVLEDFVRALGAESVDYKDKMMCCGAGGGVRTVYLDASLDFTREKVENMIEAGADVVTTPCAFCHLQFDIGQVQLTQNLKKKYELPVAFMTQLLGLALGMSPGKVGLTKNKIQVQTFIQKLPSAAEQVVVA